MKNNPPIIPDIPGKIYTYEETYGKPLYNRIYYSKSTNGLNKKLIQEYNKQFEKLLLKDANDNLAGDILDEKYISLQETEVGEEFVIFLISQIEKVYSKTIKNLYFRQSFWVNKQKRNEYNPRHWHGGILSFVYYIDVPEEIRNEWKEPKGKSNCRGLIEFTSEVSNQNLIFNPQNEDFFLFESGHAHQVYPFYSNCERISMSGNIVAIEFEDGEIIE